MRFSIAWTDAGGSCAIGLSCHYELVGLVQEGNGRSTLLAVIDVK